MSKVVVIARILLGLPFVVFGLNGFLHFLPMPPPQGAAGEFLTALGAAGYLLPLMAAIQVIAGALLLAGRAVPLALVLLAPILVNILGFHGALDPGGIGLGAFLTVIELFLAWAYRGAFKPLWATSKPTSVPG